MMTEIPDPYCPDIVTSTMRGTWRNIFTDTLVVVVNVRLVSIGGGYRMPVVEYVDEIGTKRDWPGPGFETTPAWFDAWEDVSKYQWKPIGGD